jgi:hypothetical protein
MAELDPKPSALETCIEFMQEMQPGLSLLYEHARAELAALREDRERLEWILEHEQEPGGDGGCWSRAAIDARRAP